jgi:membrane protein
MMRSPSILRELVARIQRDRITLAAAGVTYHWFFAVFPFLFAAVAAVALAGRTVSDQVISDTIAQVAPAGVDEFLSGLVTQAQASATAQSVLAIALAVALAVVSASSGMAALLQGIEVAAEAAPRPFLRRRALALALVLGTFAVAGLGVAVGSAVGATLGVPWLVTLIHRVLVVAVVVAVLAGIWAVGPSGEGPRRFWTVGSTFAAIAIVAASWAFAVFASRFNGSFAHTYGTFTSIVVLLVWFYAVALAVLIGAEVDAARASAGLRVGSAGIDTDDLHGKDDDMTETGTFRCDLCGATFETEEKLREHWDAEHAAVPAVGASRT